MAKGHAKPDPPGRTSGSVIDRLTGRLGKVTALIAATGTLAVAVLTQWERGSEQIAKLFPPAPCVVLAPAKFPAIVKLSEWDDVRVQLSGENNCPGELGLYVTYSRAESKNSSLFAIGSRHIELPTCSNYLVAESEPRCWNPKKPVVVGKGPWTYPVLLPRIERLADWQSGQKIFVDWALHNTDAPTKPAIALDTATIEIQSDILATGK